MEAGDERQTSIAAYADGYADDLNCEAPGASAEYYAIESEDSSGSETETAGFLRSECWNSQRTEPESYVDDPDFPEEADAELMALAQDNAAGHGGGRMGVW